jgi:hypothetical protein
MFIDYYNIVNDSREIALQQLMIFDIIFKSDAISTLPLLLFQFHRIVE